MFTESDNTEHLVSCDSGADKLVHENRKWSAVELYVLHSKSFDKVVRVPEARICGLFASNFW